MKRATYQRPGWRGSRAARDLRDGVRWAAAAFLWLFIAMASAAIVYLVFALIVWALALGGGTADYQLPTL